MWQILWVILILTDYKGTTGWNSQLINNTTLYETKYQCWQNTSYCLDHCRTTTALRHLAMALTTTTVTTKTSCQGGKQTGHTASCCPRESLWVYRLLDISQHLPLKSAPLHMAGSTLILNKTASRLIGSDVFWWNAWSWTTDRQTNIGRYQTSPTPLHL